MTTSLYPSVTDELIAELEAAATDSKLNIYRPFGWDHSVRCGNHMQTDSDFLSLSSPSTILALLAERATLIKDAARLEWLADNMRMEFGSCDLAQWSFDSIPHVISNREGCLVENLRDFIDQQRMIENDHTTD